MGSAAKTFHVTTGLDFLFDLDIATETTVESAIDHCFLESFNKEIR